MKTKTVKAMVAKVMTVGLLAAAVAVAMPNKAQAQEFRGEFTTPVMYGHARFDYTHRDGFEFQRRGGDPAGRVSPGGVETAGRADALRSLPW